jgi:hypothetical protein
LFATRDGMGLIDAALNFCLNLQSLDKSFLEGSAQETMFVFCKWLSCPSYIEELKTPEQIENERYYFGMDGDDGDNSGLGHHVINILSGQEIVKQNIHDGL